MNEQSTGRRGGREARRAMRAAPLAEDTRPVRPGMEGGRYRPLDDADIVKVHHAALRLLAEVGLADAPPSGVEILTRAGCELEPERAAAVSRRAGRGHAGQGRAAFRAARAGPAARHGALGQAGLFRHRGRGGQHGRRRTGAIATPRSRISTTSAASSTRWSISISSSARSLPRDLPDPFDMDFNTSYASVAATTKHVGTSWVNPRNVEASLEMLHAIAGGRRRNGASGLSSASPTASSCRR